MKRAWLETFFACAAAVAVLLFGVKGPITTFESGLWGPADPWRNGDFNGSWWLWWAFSEQWKGTPFWDAVHWPNGLGSLAAFFPNPLDMAVLGLFRAPNALFWNGVQIFHLGALLVATVVLARTLGASALSSAAGAALVAGSPAILHEVAGGRPSNLIVWPGLFALVALVRGRWKIAGVLGALQCVAYAWHGVVLVLVALPLVKDRKVAVRALGVAAVVALPYIAWLLVGWGGLLQDVPPDGYTALPLSGMVGLDSVPPRFRLHPLLLPAALVLGLQGGHRCLAGALIGLVVAIGPAPTWALGDPLFSGPTAWVAAVVPPLNRLHHPVRATLLILPLLGVAIALGVDSLRASKPAGVVLLLLGLATARWMDQGATYAQPVEPPFAREDFSGVGPISDPLGVRHLTALSLQPYHRRPLVQGPGGAGLVPDDRSVQVVDLPRFADQSLPGEPVITP
jgi:hypothetical protein